jgi:hypothetical protein
MIVNILPDCPLPLKTACLLHPLQVILSEIKCGYGKKLASVVSGVAINQTCQVFKTRRIQSTAHCQLHTAYGYNLNHRR